MLETAQRAGDETLAPSERILGRYRLKARIGRGRLGDIYKVIDETNLALGVERPIALQRLDDKFTSNQDFTEKLRRGYAALKTGSHPNVVEFLDFVCEGKFHFLVFEYLEGASLRFALDNVSALPVDEVAAIVRGAGDALKYLHAKSIFHGRVTPENIFVTDNYEVKLLDLVPCLPALPISGLEHAGNDTPLAPDAQDDTFGLACVAYELLAGRHPFNSNSALEARRAELEPVAIDSLTVRQWQALKRGLALEREQRPPTIEVFLREFGVQGFERLQSAEVDAPVEASTVSPAAPREPGPITPRQGERLVNGHQVSGPLLERAPRRGATLGRILGVGLFAGATAAAFVYSEPLTESIVSRIASIGAVSPARPETAATAEATSETALPEQPPAETPPEEAPEIEPASVAPEIESASETPDIEPASVAPEIEPAAIRNAGATLAQGQEPVADAPALEAPSPAEPGPRFSVAESSFSVREDSTAVRVVVQRTGDAAAADSAVWWTGDGTAVAEQDFAGMVEQEERFAPGEQSRTVFVPLFNDGLPEPAESFLVYIGYYDNNGRLQTIDQVNVEIVDDD